MSTIAKPTIVAVSGFSSNTGKTTLVCELLRRLPGWEAIKLTRGHYRSCGRDPQGCCVSDLIRDEALIRSGREANYEAGKDTGRFWDAGASNVTWVWSVNHVSLPDTPENRIQNYWPGKKFVDWIGFSGFNWGTASPLRVAEGEWRSQSSQYSTRAMTP